MKFLETHFEDYIQSSQKNNLNVKLEKIFKNFPNKIITHLIKFLGTLAVPKIIFFISLEFSSFCNF